MCPEDSFSDWTIEISVGGENHGRFHVHRNVLALGARKSEYFARLFARERFRESETNTSLIELESLAAVAFPVLLDYLYNAWSDELAITNENATALHHLGTYFEVTLLREKVQQFWEANLSLENCALYYEHARVFNDEKVVKAVVEKCCEHLDAIDPDSDLMAVSDENLWQDILRSNKQPNSYLSTLILQFCLTHPDDVDALAFWSLTEASFMPVVAFEAAVPLLKIEKAMNAEPESSSNDQDDSLELSSLQERCVTALASNWKFLDTPSIHKSLATFDSRVLSCALIRAVESAKASLLRAGEGIWPEAILVSGAGTKAVNGMYVRSHGTIKCHSDDDVEHSAPRFVKEGNWRGNAVRFEICLCRMLSHRWSWFISIQSKDAPGTCRDIDFYQAKSTAEGNPMLPPTNGWESVTFGDGAAPTLEFRFVHVPAMGG